MRLLVDPSAFRYRRCGLTRYYSAVCRGLRERGVEVKLPFLASGADDESDSFRLNLRTLTGRAGRWAVWASSKHYHRLLSTGRFDLALVTSAHQTDFLVHSSRTPFVLVVHDTMRSGPVPGGAMDMWSDPLYRLFYIARRAARVVCVSESTRLDLLSHGGLDDARVKVVTTGNLLPIRAPQSVAVPGLPKRFLLFIGSRQVRKNFEGTLRAFASLRPEGDLRLVCTGAFNPWESDHINAIGLAGRVLSVDVTDGELLGLYERATALVYPSLYEGFGLPVLEAMAAGCPVVASNTSSLPGVAGDAALLVNPNDPAAIASAIFQILNQPGLRESLVERGRARARQFSYDAMMDALHAEFTIAARVGRPQ